MAATKPQPSLKNFAANSLGLGKEPEAKRGLGAGLGATTASPILPPTQGVATTASPILPPTNGHVAGAKKSGAHAATGLEALDFAPSLRAPSQAALDLPAAPAAEPPPSVNGQKNGVPAPVVGGTTSMLLSQVGARAAKPRHPAVKFAVVGGVLVGLVGVITAVSLSGAEKPAQEKVAVAPPPVAAGDPEAAARAEAEKYFKSMVGEPAAAPVTKSVGPVASRRPPPRPKAAEPSTPPPLAPPPVGSTANPADTSRVSNRFGIGERKVSAPQKESRGGGDDFDISKFVAVFKQPDHHTAIKSCYERALKRDDNLKLARLDINVNVGETGSVKRVRVDAPTEFNAVSECIRDAVRRWRFPSNTKEYEAKFPLILQGKTE
jgi:hypothetical protein